MWTRVEKGKTTYMEGYCPSGMYRAKKKNKNAITRPFGGSLILLLGGPRKKE